MVVPTFTAADVPAMLELARRCVVEHDPATMRYTCWIQFVEDGPIGQARASRLGDAVYQATVDALRADPKTPLRQG